MPPIQPSPTAPESAPVVVLHRGDFGAAVAKRLEAQGRAASCLPLAEALDRRAELPTATLLVVVSWRPEPHACLELDAHCFPRGQRWSSVVLDCAELVVGPLVIPGQGPCHACARRRARTHLLLPERTDALEHAWGAHPSSGSPGYLPAMVDVAVASVWLEASAPPDAAGRVTRLDLIRSEVEEGRALGVHGCPRCGPARGAGARYTEHMVPRLREILP